MKNFYIVFGGMIGYLLAADIVFARSINLKDAGIALWVFLAVGTVIILLQAIPAFILLTAFLFPKLFKKDLDK
jgi:hypothetical protein